MKKRTSGLVIAGATLALLLSLAVVHGKPMASGCNPPPSSKGAPDGPPDTEGRHKSGPLLAGAAPDAAYLGTKLIVAYKEWVDYIDGKGNQKRFPRIVVTFFGENGQKGNQVVVSDFENDTEADRRWRRLRPPDLDAPGDLTPGGPWPVSEPSVAVHPETGTILVAFRFDHIHSDTTWPVEHSYHAIAGRFLRLHDGRLETTEAFSEPIVISSLRTGTYDELRDRDVPWNSVGGKSTYRPKVLALSTATDTFALAYVLRHRGFRATPHRRPRFFHDSRIVVKIVRASVDTALVDDEVTSDNVYALDPVDPGITGLDAAFRDTDLGKKPLPGIGWIHVAYHTDLGAEWARLQYPEDLEELGEKNLKLLSVKVDAQSLVRSGSLEVAYGAFPRTHPPHTRLSILLTDVMAEPRLLPVDEHVIVSYNDGDEVLRSKAIRMYYLRRNDGLGYELNDVGKASFSQAALLHDTVRLQDRRLMYLYSLRIEHKLPDPGLWRHTYILGSSLFEYAPQRAAMRLLAQFEIEPDLTSWDGTGRLLRHPEKGSTFVWSRANGSLLDAMGGPPSSHTIHKHDVVVPEAAATLLGMKFELHQRHAPRSPDEVLLRVQTADPWDRRFDPALGPFGYQVRIIADDAETHTIRAAGPAPRHAASWFNRDAEPHAYSAYAVLKFVNGMSFLSNPVRFELEGDRP